VKNNQWNISKQHPQFKFLILISTAKEEEWDPLYTDSSACAQCVTPTLKPVPQTNFKSCIHGAAAHHFFVFVFCFLVLFSVVYHF